MTLWALPASISQSSHDLRKHYGDKQAVDRLGPSIHCVFEQEAMAGGSPTPGRKSR